MPDSITDRTERHSLTMMVCTFASRLLGILKARAIAVVFGSGATADVINFTYNIPNSARKLFAEGAFSSAFIPYFASLQDDKKTLNQLASQIISFQLILFIPLVLFSLFAGESIIEALSAFKDPWQLELGARLLPFFTLFVLFLSVGAVGMGVLQAGGRFFISGIAPLAFSLSVIISIYMLSGTFGPLSMGIGTVIGALAQMSICLFSASRQGLHIRLNFHFRSKLFVSMLSRWLPATLTSLIAIISQQITFYFASGLPAGSITAFSNAIIFWQTPYGIFFTAVSSVYFPLFSVLKDEKKKANALSEAAGYLTTFLLPSAIILFVLAHPCVAVLLQHGAFTLENTLLTANVLQYYLIGLCFFGLYYLLQRYLYSQDDYNFALFISILGNGIDICMTYILIKNGVGPEALPISYTLSILLSIGILCFRIGRKFPYRSYLRAIAKIIAANIPLFLASIAYLCYASPWWISGSNFHNLCILASCFIVAGLIILSSYIAFHIPFLDKLVGKRGK